MSDSNSSQTCVRKNWLNKIFHLDKFPQTSLRTELLAGISTFMTMAYVLGTVPNLITGEGSSINAANYLTAMIILIIITTVTMAIYTNRPFALAPGLGSVAIVAGLLKDKGISADIATAIIIYSGLIFVLISFIGLREAVVKAIPKSLKQAVSAGIGLFIAILGARSCGLIAANAKRPALIFGDLKSPTVILAAIGFLLIIIFKAASFKGDMILAIIITTLIGIPMGITKVPQQIFSLPANPFALGVKVNMLDALSFSYLPFIFALFIPDFFSTFGTVLGVGTKAGYLDKDGNLPGIDKCFKVDAISTVLGGFFCMPSMTTYLESSAGVEEGGKTGLTVIFTSLCFALCLFISPLALMIPSAATAPALIYVGINMLSSLRLIKFDDLTEAFPAFVCVAFTIFGNNIANGITVAIPIYVIMKLASRRHKDLHPMIYVLLLLSILYYYSILK